MNDKRGFWLAVGGALLASSGFLVLQFVRTSRYTGETLPAWILVGAMAASLVPLMLLIGFIVASVYGWAARAKQLRLTGSWDVIVPALRSDQMIRGLRQADPRAAHRIPRGLTLTADSRGIGIWSGRSAPFLEVWLPWGEILEIQPVVARDTLESFRAVGIFVRSGDSVVELPVPVTGGFPFETRTATPKALDALIRSLNGIRGHQPFPT